MRIRHLCRKKDSCSSNGYISSTPVVRPELGYNGYRNVFSFHGTLSYLCTTSGLPLPPPLTSLRWCSGFVVPETTRGPRASVGLGRRGTETWTPKSLTLPHLRTKSSVGQTPGNKTVAILWLCLSTTNKWINKIDRDTTSEMYGIRTVGEMVLPIQEGKMLSVSKVTGCGRRNRSWPFKGL